MINPEHYVHHKTAHYIISLGKSSFSLFNLDTFIIGLLVGAGILVAAIRVVRHASPYKLTVGQNILEMCVESFSKRIKDSKSNLWALSIIISLFMWIITMNLLDLLPNNLYDFFGINFFGENYPSFSLLPTEDFNTTFALAFFVLVASIVFAIKSKGLKGFLASLMFQPFGKWLLPFNLFQNLLEYLTKPAGLAMRLFGNMFAGSIIFTILSIFPWYMSWILKIFWSILHGPILIVQAFIFVEITMQLINHAQEKS